VLEDGNGLLMREALERDVVDGDDLVAAADGARGGGGARLEHRLHVDGQVAVRRVVAADDAEAEAVLAARQPHLATRQGRLGGGRGGGRDRGRARQGRNGRGREAVQRRLFRLQSAKVTTNTRN